MAYDVSALGSFTKQNAKSLIYKQIAEGTTSSMMTVQPGIKSAETINIVSTTAVWQTGGSCGFNASGDTTYSQRTLTVGKIKINLTWCEKDLEPKYLQGAMKAGGTYTMLTFEEQIIGDITQNTSSKVEHAIWKGDTTAGSAYLNKFDGLIKIIGAASGVVTATPVAWSVTNSRTALQNVYSSLTDDMLAQKNLKVFIGLSEARDYRMKLGLDNLYHISGAEGKLYIENTDIELVPVLGLSGTKKIYALSTDNMFLGTDLANEEEKYDLFFAKEADQIRYVSEFKLGVQVAFPDQIVQQINT